jgi:hypothetical protein
MARIRSRFATAALITMALSVTGAPGVAAAKPQPFCPTAFTAASVETLADLLTGFATLDQVRAFDTNGDDTLCYLRIPGVGYQILDDGTPR